MVVQSLDEVGPMVPLRDELLVLRDELSLAAPDPLHVRLKLLDLVNLALATVTSCHLIEKVKDFTHVVRGIGETVLVDGYLGFIPY